MDDTLDAIPRENKSATVRVVTPNSLLRTHQASAEEEHGQDQQSDNDEHHDMHRGRSCECHYTGDRHSRSTIKRVMWVIVARHPIDAGSLRGRMRGEDLGLKPPSRLEQTDDKHSKQPEDRDHRML